MQKLFSKQMLNIEKKKQKMFAFIDSEDAMYIYLKDKIDILWARGSVAHM